MLKNNRILEMINIKNKQDCCGCSACSQRCPKHCISMQMDNEVFLYPHVDSSKCIDCHLCEKVCPCLNQEESQQPLSCYAAKNKDEEIRKQSSSGGIFTALAEKVLVNKGVVFGACFDNNWQVIHTYIEKKQDIAIFRGSKYVQSQIGETFKQAESFLKEGQIVLFSGTPCQISGLNHYLRKQYDNLLTVEVVCHGVPSPKIWREYLRTLNIVKIGSISHKDKSTGWRGYSFTVKNTAEKVVFTERAYDNKYMMAFNRNLTLRPSCFSCPAKAGKSKADITLADFWGIENIIPKMDDNKGTSFICGNTQKGKIYIKELNIQLKQVDYQKTIQYNSCILKSTIEPTDRLRFWGEYKKRGIKVLLLLKKQKPNIIKRIIKRLLK